MNNNTEQITTQKRQGGILIIDDDEDVRKRLQRKLTDKGYKCYEATNTEQALSKLKNSEVHLAILDSNVPDMSGVDLLLKIQAGNPDVAVVVSTDIGGTSVGIECMELGAYEYITKPLILEEVVLVVDRVLEKRWLELLRKEYQQHLQVKLGEQAKIILDLSLRAITALAHALEAKDKYTRGHSQRVAEISVAIGNKMCLPQESIEKIQLAGLVHDIGKIGVNDFVLNKPSNLTNEEFKHVRCHPEIGEHIIAPIINDNETLKLVRNHHERYDGTGYPDGLTNTQMPLGTKILTLADAYDAMTSERPYRKAMSNKTAFAEIEHAQGTQFDPEVVAVLYRLPKCDL
ncbi:HD domain-containing phosphohydrolase [Chloroflexota bacterium]